MTTPFRVAPAFPLSPLELLLPRGVARRFAVLGSACPSSLLPGRAGVADAVPTDLLVLAPSAEQRRSAAWVDEAVRRAASSLSPDGIAYLLAPTRRLRRRLAGAGLREDGLLLHVPDRARSRLLVQIGTAAERYALSGHVGMTRHKRLLAAAGLRVPGIRALAPSGVLLRPRKAPALAQWAFEIDRQPRAPGSVILHRSSRPRHGIVVYRFAGDDVSPDAVVKVSPRALAEQRALLEVAAGAERAGARVPKALATGELGAVPIVLESPVEGRSARFLLDRGLPKERFAEQISKWLARWGALEAERRALTHNELERHVLAPAGRLAAVLPESSAFVQRLERLCADSAGTVVPFVPAHNDLTAANLLIDQRGSLGVVDWEEACTDSLPLVDFFYAVTDVLADSGGGSARKASFASCFASDGSRRSLARVLEQHVVSALEVPAPVVELCFLSAWLCHATNELVDEAPDGSGPFVAIVRAIAREPGRFTSATAGCE